MRFFAAAYVLTSLSVTESSAPLTKMAWVENVYPSDFNFGISFSKVHSSDLTTGKGTGFMLTLRPKTHIVSPWARIEGDDTLRAFNDKGYFVEFFPSSGRYSLRGGYKAFGGERGDGLIADFPALSQNRRLFALSPLDSLHFNVRALDAKTGAVLEPSVGVMDLGAGVDACFYDLYKSWVPASEQLYVAKNYCSHSTPGRIYSFNPAANSTKALYTLRASDESFCGFTAHPSSTGDLFALVEKHNITAFPDPDCQNLSGTMVALKVIKIDRHGKSSDVYSAPLPSSTIVGGGPMDDAAGIWHLLAGGGVTPVDLAAGKVLRSLAGDVEGDYPVLVGGPGAGEDSTMVV